MKKIVTASPERRRPAQPRDTMLPPEYGIGSNGGTFAPQAPSFAKDHQLPMPDAPGGARRGTAVDAQGLAVLSGEEIKLLRDRGDEIVFPGRRPDGENRRF